ncbi:MAG: hypothetical protein QXI12_05435 [Candidatus Methanomethyliaceae archaeon]
MSNFKINERILKSIRESSKGDEAVERFLIDLIYEEANHPGQWWWKDTYRKLLDKYSAAWRKSDED